MSERGRGIDRGTERQREREEREGEEDVVLS